MVLLWYFDVSEIFSVDSLKTAKWIMDGMGVPDLITTRQNEELSLKEMGDYLAK